MSMVSIVSTAALASLALKGAMAQGDAAALVSGDFNKPTQSWQQWQPKPTYALEDLPDQYMGANRIPGGGEPQSGWNRCAENAWNQKSLCQTAYINDINDWCIWGPPDGGDIGSTERVAVAYCTTNKHGTRLIPDGTITGAHFLQTPNYVQISGVGDFTTIGVPAGDSGGEMDSAGADDLGNPIGGVIFTTANPESNGEPVQIRHWTNFMSFNQFCLRACWGDQASARCEHIYDVLGCRWNMPSTTGYDAGVFDTCEGDNAPLQGIFGGSTFQQGQPVTPDAHPPAPSSNCVTTSSIRHGLFGESVDPTTTSAAPSTSTASAAGEQERTTDSLATPALSSSTPTSAPTSMATSAAGNGASVANADRAADSSSSNQNQGNGAGSLTSPFAASVCLSVVAIVGAILA